MLGLALLFLSACRQDVRFTDIPPLVTSFEATGEELTSLFVPVPVQLAPVLAQADQSIPQNFKRIVAWLKDAACYKVKTYTRCQSARAELYLSRDGAPKIVSAGRNLNLEMAFNYVLKSRGLGAARRVNETVSGKLTAVAGLKVTLGRALAPSVQLSDRISWSSNKIKVMSGMFDLSEHAGGRIKRLLRGTAERLALELQKAPLLSSAKKVWSAIHTPIKLQSEPDIWLTNEPRYIGHGGFVLKNGKPIYRVAIGTRMTILFSSVRPQSQFVASMPRNGKSLAAPQRSSLSVPLTVQYDTLAKALKTAWLQPIEMRVGAGKKPMRVTVNDAEFYPSNELLALGLDLDVVAPDRAFDLTGKAYLTARPVFDEKTRKLRLDDIKIARTNVILGVGPGTGRRLRLRAAPFVERLNTAVNVNVAQPLAELLATTNAMLNQDIGNGLWLRGRFDLLNVSKVSPQREGFEMGVDLTGDLSISADAMQAQAAIAVKLAPRQSQ